MNEPTNTPPLTRPVPKPWIAKIHPYVPGKSARDFAAADGRLPVKLSANENPLGTSALALAARASAVVPSLYPDSDSKSLREALGQLHAIDPSRIICGTGSGELLTIAVSAFAGPGDEVLTVRHSFSLYDILIRRCGASPVVAPDQDYGTCVDHLLSHVRERTRLVLVANPNNPTGTFLSRSELARLHAGLRRDILLVVDQAYAEYVAPEDDDGGLELAATCANVLVTRTFSKAYGLAGERVGWATGEAGLIAMLNRIRGSFPLSNSGQATALAALSDQAFVEHSRIHNASVRASFCAALAALGNRGISVVPSEANFVLVLFEGVLHAEEAFNGLVKAGYITRGLGGQGLPQALRITIGTQEQMDAIARALAAMSMPSA